MEWVFYLIVIAPMIFAPMVLFDIFSLPQTALLCLLSGIGMILLGTGEILLDLPVLLSLSLIGYMAVNTFWTEVLDGARKEFAVQLPLLLVFILAVHLDPSSLFSVLIVMYGAGSLVQLYAFGQTFGIDFVFPTRLKMDSKDKRPISTIGNMNFFASYILPMFWLGIYLSLSVSFFFLFGVSLTCFLLWKTKCRGALLGLIGSVYGFFLFLSFGNFISINWLKALIPFTVLTGVVVAAWLWKNWERINKERINGSKTTKLATLRYRICYWKAGWHLFKQKIWQGHGLRSYRKLVYFAQAALNDKDPEFLDPNRYITPQPRECHNDWLEDLVELGLLGSAIRWGLVGSIFYFGAMVLEGSLLMLFLLTTFLSIAIHGLFFFSLRIPSTGMVFWALGGFIVLLASPAFQTVTLPFVFLPMLAAFFALFLWEMVAKDVIASYYFMRFQKGKNLRQKELDCNSTVKWAPKETMYNTYLLIGHLNVSPQTAYKYAEEMWHNYDGMSPGWVVYLNMATAAEVVGNKELAYRHYATSYRLLPTFVPAIQKLNFLEPYIPFPRRGEIMKKVKEEAKLNIQLFHERLQNLDLQKQNLQVGIQNVILQEAGRLNIPEGWHYDIPTGEFLSPEELLQKQQTATVEQQPPVTENETKEEPKGE